MGLSDLISCILGILTDKSISVEGVLSREDHYFPLNMVIFLIFTFKQDFHWERGMKLSLGVEGRVAKLLKKALVHAICMADEMGSSNLPGIQSA